MGQYLQEFLGYNRPYYTVHYQRGVLQVRRTAGDDVSTGRREVFQVEVAARVVRTSRREDER